MNRTSACLFVGASALFSQRSLADENPCVSVYGPTVQRINFQQAEAATYSFLSQNACSESNRNITAGFDSKTKAIIGGIPVIGSMMGSAGYSSNKQFCDAQAKVSSSTSANQWLLIEPLQFAQENFNECMRIFSRGRVEVTHDVASPGLVTFFIQLGDPDQRLEIQGIEATPPFTCTTVNRGFFGGNTVGTNTSITLKRNETIKCTRPPSSYPAGGFEYPNAVISLGTSVGTYTVRIPEETILGPTTKREATAALAIANESLRVQASMNAKLKELLATPRVESKPFYFGAYDVDRTQSHGKRYDCALWHNANWQSVVPQDLCPGANKTAINHLLTHSGNACGYNFFTLACLYYPQTESKAVGAP